MWQGGEQLPSRPCPSPLPPLADAQLQACHAAGRGGAGAGGGWQRISRQRGGEVCPGSSIFPLSILSNARPHPRGLPATKWAVGAGLGAKLDLAVPRDVLGVSQNAAQTVPG